MFTRNGQIILQAPASIEMPRDGFIGYTDSTGQKVSIPLGLIVRLQAIARLECEERGGNWEAEAVDAALIHCGS